MPFVGDDWAEDHHDIEIVAEDGRRLARRRLPEGLAGISQLHALIAAHLPQEEADLPPGEAAGQVKVGIETERGPWVQALVAAGYEVFPVTPMSAARYRERHSTSGAKPDAADAHLPAEIARLAEAVKLTARAHQSLIWDRSRHVLRLRAVLREFFPAALAVFTDLDAPDALELLSRAPDPGPGTRKIVIARYARNRRLADALQQWAFCCMRGSPGARAYYKALRARGIGHQGALRQLSNRLVGMLHGCLASRTPYDEDTAWNHYQQSAA